MLRGKKKYDDSPFVFSSKSQTLPPKEWDKCQREEMFPREPSTISQAARAKGVGSCLIPLLPNFSAKLFLPVSNTPLTSSDWKEMDRLAKPPICTGFTLSLFSVGKTPIKSITTETLETQAWTYTPHQPPQSCAFSHPSHQQFCPGKGKTGFFTTILCVCKYQHNCL